MQKRFSSLFSSQYFNKINLVSIISHRLSDVDAYCAFPTDKPTIDKPTIDKPTIPLRDNKSTDTKNNSQKELEGLSLEALFEKVPLGILLGLFIGKQLGVFVFSYISIKLKVAQMPNNLNWFNLYGVGVLTGIGFTMSLFVGNLAFVENMQYMDGVKIGVLTGSLLSTLFGYFLILLTPNKPDQ